MSGSINQPTGRLINILKKGMDRCRGMLTIPVDSVFEGDMKWGAASTMDPVFVPIATPVGGIVRAKRISCHAWRPCTAGVFACPFARVRYLPRYRGYFGGRLRRLRVATHRIRPRVPREYRTVAASMAVPASHPSGAGVAARSQPFFRRGCAAGGVLRSGHFCPRICQEDGGEP